MPRDDRFEWDDVKAKRNLGKHGISFEDGAKVFDDPYAIDRPDRREDYGEERWSRTGMVDGRLLTVSYTERDERIRIVSVRKANKREQDDYVRQDA